MSASTENLLRHREAKVTWLEEACPVVVFDDAIPNLKELQTFALEMADFKPLPSGVGYYPGLRANLPPEVDMATAGTWKWLSEILWRDVFRIDPTSLFSPYFEFDASLVGQPPCLALYSPAPQATFEDIHEDSHSVFAAVGYLNGDFERTGTKFWRDKRTGSVASWNGEYRALLDIEKVFGLRLFDKWRDSFACRTVQPLAECKARGHHGSRGDRFEEVLHVAAKPGRIVAYPTWVSHSIGYSDYVPPRKRQDARITINKFLPWPIRLNEWALQPCIDIVNPSKC
jgi:hypothetical protein